MVPDTLYQPGFQRSKKVELYMHISTLIFSHIRPSFMFSGEYSYYNSLELSLTDHQSVTRTRVRVGKCLPTPAPTLTPAKPADLGRLQLQLRLRLHSPSSKYEN